jgi:hypothetical protein
MSKSTYNTDPTPEPVIKSMNPEALNYLNWFMSDANSLRNWAGQIFGSDIDLNSPKLMELKNAAQISLSELEDDIAKIKEFIATYIPTNNN